MIFPLTDRMSLPDCLYFMRYLIYVYCNCLLSVMLYILKFTLVYSSSHFPTWQKIQKTEISQKRKPGSWFTFFDFSFQQKFDCWLLFLGGYSIKIAKYLFSKPEKQAMASLWRNHTYKKFFNLKKMNKYNINLNALNSKSYFYEAIW